MKSVKIVLMYTMILVGSFLPYAYTQNIDTAYQSVVQVMSYDAIYGKYPVLRGRGSASLISSDGVLLTNNHVVSKENGNPLTTFAICVSSSISSRPDCRYTASLIKKDEQKDIALLRMDPVDIDGGKVDFSKFVPLVLATDYVPKAQDKTLAIGYPSVGADTITQTIGVVAGTQQYNDATYIKTDAAISPGNSGGPLIKDGTVIGVNTFTMGESSSLGYALLISQAKSFIDLYSASPSVSSSISVSGFQNYLTHTNRIQTQKKVLDQVFSFSFLKSYVITNYIPNTQLEGQLQMPDDTNVQAFAVNLKRTLPMQSYDDLIYILKTNYGYNPSFHTLQKDTIGGMTMYSFVDTTDISQGEGDTRKIYIAQYNSNTLIELALALPSLDDKTKQALIKSNIQTFLASLSFTSGYVVPVNPTLTLSNPGLHINLLKGMFTNIIDTADNYISSWGSSTSPFVVYPFKNAHENITYTLIDNAVDLGSTKTLEERFTITTEGIPSQQKSLISYMGYPGYVYCTEQETDAIHYTTDKETRQGVEVAMGLCRMVVYIGHEQDTILQIDLNGEKSKLQSQQQKLLSTIKKTLYLNPIGDGSTSLPSQIMQSRAPVFTDTKDQSDDFNAYLALLVRYGILSKTPTVALETAMTYRSYLALYLKAIYNITEDKTDTILGVAGINPDLYVDNSNKELFATLVQSRLAGVILPDYSHKTLSRFQLLSQSTYREDWKKIEEFEYTISNGTKFTIDKVLSNIYSTSYIAYTTLVYDPVTGLKKNILYNDKGNLATPSFGTISDSRQQDKIISCAKKSMMDKQCMSFYKNLANTIVPYSPTSYNVLTRGEALDTLKVSIDIGLFDPQWKSKKNK